MLFKLIVFLPLVGFLIAGMFGRQIGDRASMILTSGLVSIAGILSWFAFFDVTAGGNQYSVHVLSWVTSGTLTFDWAFHIDTLTAVMLIVVNTVSALVHWYSMGYMEEDPHKPRFFAYLSLFTFAMLMLVTSDNLVQMFFGWEGVGLASYLLIGFWYKKPSANAAAIKAFVVNRVGDFGFALGIYAVFLLVGSVEFSTIFARIGEFETATVSFLGTEYHAITVAALLLFVGAMGKSAQLGLHTWLPDAMEGPTPVSALIHAATMVTAGVFLVARFSPLFDLSPVALSVVTYIGAATALFAASVGLVQNDIKRVIAYSTCSQLGYMFVALGVTAYGGAIFHLFTHAFFKALLFLGAGSVIHAMHHEQDMRKMGGIYKKIPLTYIVMLIGTLAITGVPFLSGYYSKDLIIEAAYAADAPGAQFAFVMTVVAALMTSFYSWRLIFLTFHGQTRADNHTFDHAHEGPAVMTIPLIMLAVGALAAGGYFASSFIGDGRFAFWNGALVTTAGDVMDLAHEVPSAVVWAPFIAMILGLFISACFYRPQIKMPAVAAFGLAVAAVAVLVLVPSQYAGYAAVAALALSLYVLFGAWGWLSDDLPKRTAETWDGLYAFILNKWYFDELYDFLFVRPAFWLGKIFWKKGDEATIDGFGPNGVSALVAGVAARVRKLQTGYVYHYAFAMIIGLALVVTWFMMQGGAH
ncbi:MAG: NADH-quinone oxidoreductase subunit L [Kordiimonadaceae bacterium]|nr:NADH-quinone oxidoreductase subunit L [Kordiimonadaceae bacterium]MBO6570349.1 NADH-quinone oxidoreductase subunit L [Kordiimonadaceae bacterium]MBO6965553.1 NADH-quinone oxidoreductase subunit L [Kordiimonadaceae bacterium]